MTPEYYIEDNISNTLELHKQIYNPKTITHPVSSLHSLNKIRSQQRSEPKRIFCLLSFLFKKKTITVLTQKDPIRVDTHKRTPNLIQTNALRGYTGDKEKQIHCSERRNLATYVVFFGRIFTKDLANTMHCPLVNRISLT